MGPWDIGVARRAMDHDGAGLAWYRFRSALRRRWTDYAALVLLIGLVGGLAMGSVAAARRTASSFSVYWASTNPSDLVGGTGILDPKAGLEPYETPVVEKISHLPHVESIESQSGINLLPLQPDGAPEPNVTEFSPGPATGTAAWTGFTSTRTRSPSWPAIWPTPTTPANLCCPRPRRRP